MQCYGGKDNYGCEVPEFCRPNKGGPVGNDGYECPFHCPTKCDADYMQCPEGEDGNECPVTCPTRCGNEDMYCPGGDDGNGCMMPDICVPKKRCPWPRWLRMSWCLSN